MMKPISFIEQPKMSAPFRIYGGLTGTSGHAFSTKVIQNQKRPSENASEVIALFQDEAI